MFGRKRESDELPEKLLTPNVVQKEIEELLEIKSAVVSALINALAIGIPLYFYVKDIVLTVGVSTFIFFVLLQGKLSKEHRKLMILGKMVALFSAMGRGDVTAIARAAAEMAADGKITPEELRRFLKLLERTAGGST